MTSLEPTRERLKLDALVYGQRLDVNPYSVLLNEVQWRAGHVEWLRTQVQALPSVEDMFLYDENGRQHDVGVLRRYDKERDLLDRAVKVAIDAGIAERYVRLAELHGQVLFEVLQTALDDPLVSLEPSQRVGLIEAMKRAVAASTVRQELEVESVREL